MSRRITILGALAIAAASGALLGASETLRIVPLTSDDTVVVTVELPDAYNAEMRQAIASGLRTTFTYDIELRMAVPTWVDRTIATASVSSTDQYDNLTRRHALQRIVDGRVQEALVTEDDAVAMKWLTSLTRVPLVDTSKLDPNRDYYVRISARARPHGGSIIGWASAVVGQAKFTFIP